MHKSQVKCDTMLRSLMKIPDRLDEICSYKPMGLSVYNFFTGWSFLSNTYKHRDTLPTGLLFRVGSLPHPRVLWRDLCATSLIGTRANIERISMPEAGK